jgi:hypothetical protein
MIITSSFKLDTNKTLDNPRKAPGVEEPRAPVDARAKAPRLGIPLPYALANAGAPNPIAVKGGRTPGVPMPFTALKFSERIIFHYQYIFEIINIIIIIIIVTYLIFLVSVLSDVGR